MNVYKSKQSEKGNDVAKISVSVSKRTLKTIGTCCMIAILVLVSCMGGELYHTRDYLYTDGVVTSVKKMTSYGVNGSGSTTGYRVVCYSYQANGQQFEKERRTILPVIYRFKKSMPVFYDPIQPERIRDLFIVEISMTGILFLGIFLCFILAAHRQAEK